MIVDELAKGTHIFIILDEILKGTNSNDKMKGSKSLLKQFLNFKSVGIIATHDISLGDLEVLYPDNIKNKSFEVAIEGDWLYYDYKLQEGTCKNLNASHLMKKMGIILE
jgi:DNA mismatch repair ATPase MutS